jgi:ABC-type multidrug transport system fused ATPase/permease subunit
MKLIKRLKFLKIQIKKILKLFNQSDKRKLIFLVLINASVAILDLFGVGLIGAAVAIFVRSIQSQAPGDKVQRFLDFFNLENLSNKTILIILLSVSVSFFLAKTAASIIVTKKTLNYISFRNAEISSSLFSRWLNAPYLTNNKQSDQFKLFSITQGVNNLILGLISSITLLIGDVVLVFIIFFGLFIIDPLVSVITLLLFVCLGISLFKLLHKKVTFFSQQNTKLVINLNQRIVEAFNSYRDLYIRGGREFYSNRTRIAKFEMAKSEAELKFLPNISKFTLEVSIVLGIALLAIFQFFFSDINRASVVFSLFLAASTRLGPAILRIQQNLTAIISNFALSVPTLSLINSLENVQELPTIENHFKINHPNFKPIINIVDVNFKYDLAFNNVLSNITLKINHGDFVAIVGPSGGGKSSLLDLILGISEPDSGYLEISGMEPRSTITNWPGAIGYVPQKVFISESTIKSNICLGYDESKIDDSLVWKALEKADLFHFVDNLDGKLNFKIFDQGSNLSGGERQRIGIARALLTNPSLLIFDEATSALDAETENRISESILKLTGECTVIFIAHRLSVVRRADMIYYIDKGKIVSQGSFDELRKLNADFNNQANFMGI